MEKVTKRDFLKLLGITSGAATVATRASELPKTETICELPTAQFSDGAAFARGDYSYAMDARDSILYDSVYFAPGQALPQRFRLFQTPRGQRCLYSAKVKWSEDTNMDCTGMLPAPTSFWIKSIRVAASPETSDWDIETIHKYAWTFWLCQKRHAQGPCILDMERKSISGLLKSNSRPLRASMSFQKTKGLYVPSQMCFNQEFETGSEQELYANSRGNGILFITALEGVEWRGLQ